MFYTAPYSPQGMVMDMPRLTTEQFVAATLALKEERDQSGLPKDRPVSDSFFKNMDAYIAQVVAEHRPQGRYTCKPLEHSKK